MGHGQALQPLGACSCSSTNLWFLCNILFYFQIYRIYGTFSTVHARVVADAQAEDGLNAGWLGGPPQVPLLLVLEAANPLVVAGSHNLDPHSLMMVLGSVRPKQAQLAAQAEVFASSATCATLRALEALGAQACIRCCHHCWLRQQLSRLEAIELFDAGPATGVANSIERLLRPPLPCTCKRL